jgi:hypothetical protein
MKPSECGVGGRLWNLPRTWPLILLLACAIECHSASADDTKANYVFVDGAAVTLTPDSSNVFTFDTPIKNSGKAGGAKALVKGKDDPGCTLAKIADPETITLPANTIEIQHFKITGANSPATCYVELVTDGAEGNTSLKQIKLTSQIVSCFVLILLAVCLAISAGIAAHTGHSITKTLQIGWRYTLGSPAWDFAKSWFSTTTLVGAIISAALALSGLPELTKYASKSGYSVLALLISLVVIVAPFIFIVFRTGAIKEDGKDNTTKKFSVEYEGSLWAFVVSCAATLFAGLAQVIVLGLLFHEVFQALWSLIAGLIFVAVLGLGLWIYSVQSMWLTVKLQKAEKDAREGKDNAGNKIVIDRPLPSWSVL